jgi:protein NirF
MNKTRNLLYLLLLIVGVVQARGTGDLGVIIERADSSVQIVETSSNTSIGRVEGLGDLSHASIVYSRDARFAYVFGRDGGLSKVDILDKKLVGRTLQSGNSIGGAISQDGRLVAVSNYKPGGVKIFDADTLKLIADIPATSGSSGQRSKVIGLVDAPGQKFVFSLWDSGEIWVVDMSDVSSPKIQKFKDCINSVL